MNFLILVKHAMPTIDPSQPAHTWELAPAAQQSCRLLATHLQGYLPAYLSCSPEPKAHATATLLGEALGLIPHVVAGLEEQHRATASYLTPPIFQQTLARFFANPGQLVFGEETADGAHARFSTTIEQLLSAAPETTQIVVTHGTVMSLFVSRSNGLQPFPLWQRLGLPSFVVLALPTMQLVAEVDTIE